MIYKYNQVRLSLTKSTNISHLVQQNASKSTWFKIQVYKLVTLYPLATLHFQEFEHSLNMN